MSRPAPGAAPPSAREVVGVDPQSELLGLAVVVLDLLWMHPLLALIGGALPGQGAGDPQARVALWPLIAVAVLARAVVWLLARRGAVSGAIFTAAAGLVALPSLAILIWVEFYSGPAPLAGGFFNDILSGFTAPVMIGVLLAGGYAWWRTLQGYLLELGAVYLRFELIVVAYLLYTGAAWLGQAAYLPPVLTRDLFLVFLAGLWATALARSRMEGARSHQLLNTRWFVFSLSLIAVVLGIGLLAGSLFAPDLAAALFAPLLTVVQLIGLVVVLAGEALAFVVLFVLNLLFGGIHLQPPPPTPTPTPAPPGSGSINNLLQQQATTGGLDPAVFSFLGALVLLVIFILLARAVLRSAEGRRRMLAQGERESLLNWRAVLDSLRPASAAPPPPDPLLALARDSAYRYTVRVRQIYREALARAAAREVTRLPAQTADEVLPAMQRVFPAAARDPLRDLTAIYDATRYTQTPATLADAAAAERALQALVQPPDSP